jgi:two-component system chemotaxis response regulator CheY
MRLLVVEDSPLLRKMFRLAFPQQFNDLRQSQNGREAIELLSATSEPFAVVLLDLRMPDMNGIEFIKAVRRLPAHDHTPIVLTTAEASSSALLREATSLGVAAVVRKPWTPRHLRTVVEKLLDHPNG